MAVTAGTLTLQLSCKKRWWFGLARIATIILIMARIIRDTDKAATWLAKHGLIMKAEPLRSSASEVEEA